MGCMSSSNGSYPSDGTQPKPQTELEHLPSTSYPVPFGHLPYNPSLPGAMGPLWSFPVEWWYYGGWAQATSQIDNQPAPKFTLFLQTVRASKDVVMIYGIGTTLNSKQLMLINQSVASGFHCEKS